MTAAESASDCSNCGHRKMEHWLANYSDGPKVGQEFLVCPTSTFRGPVDRGEDFRDAMGERDEPDFSRDPEPTDDDAPYSDDEEAV